MSREIIIVHESIAASIVKDIASVTLLTATVGAAVYIGSGVLQWFACFCWLVALFVRANKYMNANTFTVETARKRLDELEREFAKVGNSEGAGR